MPRVDAIVEEEVLHCTETMFFGEAEPKPGAMVRGILFSYGRDVLRQLDALAAEFIASNRLLVLWLGGGQLQSLAVREHRYSKLLRLAEYSGHCSVERKQSNTIKWEGYLDSHRRGRRPDLPRSMLFFFVRTESVKYRESSVKILCCSISVAPNGYVLSITVNVPSGTVKTNAILICFGGSDLIERARVMFVSSMLRL